MGNNYDVRALLQIVFPSFRHFLSNMPGHLQIRCQTPFALSSLLLLTPPFTQVNTPYPATAYLKGFLDTLGIASRQADLGIDTLLAVFSRQGLQEMFDRAKEGPFTDANIGRINTMQARYLETIDPVIAFLQGKAPTLAHHICSRRFLPEAARFSQLADLEIYFGQMGIQDKAKHLATMYLEDLGDFIKAMIDPHFGFSRYAESLGRCANSFDELAKILASPPSWIDQKMFGRLEEWAGHGEPPLLVCVSVPFPGNLLAGFRSAQWFKHRFPSTKTALGGGFANTELRSLKEPRVFDYFDYVTLDDGEAPLQQLIGHLQGKWGKEALKRTFLREDGQVGFWDNPLVKDHKQGSVGTPNYEGLRIDEYLSVIESLNPMHSLWGDGRWNKLTMAHGCYWGKCTFCDVSLDYIGRYEPVAASVLCDRMETMIEQTGESGFHFVDEAAPPALMRALSLEILRRKLVVSWWANIRFEKSFSEDLCLLLKQAGCIAVSGGLEVASDRLLALIEKGVTVGQVAMVLKNFSKASIMTHAYLMYGYPTQTAQETIDSLEMVRQLFKSGVLRSAFWHRFALTVHSPIGKDPAKYGVTILQDKPGDFANNDLPYSEPNNPTDHDAFGYGLEKSLLNYMHCLCLDDPLHKWFDHKVPKTKVAPDHIVRLLEMPESLASRPATKLVFIGTLPTIEKSVKTKKGQQWETATLRFETNQATMTIQLPWDQGEWLWGFLAWLIGQPFGKVTMADAEKSYENAGLEHFPLFFDNKPVSTLNRAGLLRL